MVDSDLIIHIVSSILFFANAVILVVNGYRLMVNPTSFIRMISSYDQSSQLWSIPSISLGGSMLTFAIGSVLIFIKGFFVLNLNSQISFFHLMLAIGNLLCSVPYMYIIYLSYTSPTGWIMIIEGNNENVTAYMWNKKLIISLLVGGLILSLLHFIMYVIISIAIGHAI